MIDGAPLNRSTTVTPFISDASLASSMGQAEVDAAIIDAFINAVNFASAKGHAEVDASGWLLAECIHTFVRSDDDSDEATSASNDNSVDRHFAQS
jgi:hypothetical protein